MRRGARISRLLSKGWSSSGYSAALSSDGVFVLLIAAVVPALTYEVQNGSGSQRLQTLAVLSIIVGGGRLQVLGAFPSGITLEPGQQSGLDMQFLPSAVGQRNGS